MTLGWQMDGEWVELGREELVYAFFSTAVCRLEKGKCGRRFPRLTHALLRGTLLYKHIDAGMQELTTIWEEMKALSPAQVVADYKAPKEREEWMDAPRPDMANLTDWFVTADGESLFDQCMAAMRGAKARGCPLVLGMIEDDLDPIDEEGMPGGIGFQARDHYFDIGTLNYVLSFFSTICLRLEKGNWGKRFPRIMKELYMGKIGYRHLQEAMKEMEAIEWELQGLPVSLLVWDSDEPDKQLPNPRGEGNAQAPNLAAYFTCTEGETIFELFAVAAADARRRLCPLTMQNIWG